MPTVYDWDYMKQEEAGTGLGHFDHVHVDTRLGETQSGDGSAVSGADDEGRDTGPGVDRSGCGTDPGLSSGAVTREGHGA